MKYFSMTIRYGLLTVTLVATTLGCQTTGRTPVATVAPTSTAAQNVTTEAPLKLVRDKKLNRPIDEATAAKACLETGRNLQSQGRDALAVTMFERALQTDPELRGVSRSLAVLYDRQGEYFKAEKHYRQALKETPKDATLWNDFGYYNYVRGRYDEAIAALTKAVKLDEFNEIAVNNLALTYAKVGRWQDARATFERTVGPAAAAYNLAALKAQMGETNSARELIAEAIDAQPTLDRAYVLAEKLADRPAVQQVSFEQ